MTTERLFIPPVQGVTGTSPVQATGQTTQAIQPVEAPSVTSATKPVNATGAIAATQPVEASVVIAVTQSEPRLLEPTGQTVAAKKSGFPLSLSRTAHPEEQDSDYYISVSTPPLAVMWKKRVRSLIRNQMRVFEIVTRRSVMNRTIERQFRE